MSRRPMFYPPSTFGLLWRAALNGAVAVAAGVTVALVLFGVTP